MIPLKTFGGEFPRLKPTLLPDTAAQESIDCDHGNGVLSGIRSRQQLLGLTVPAGVKSIYVHEGSASRMFAWTRDVDVVRGPVANDEFNRFYWSDGTNFYVSRGDVGGSGQEPSSTNRYKVGCPSPATPLVIDESEVKLKLPDTESQSFSAIYEMADGSTLSEHELGNTTLLEYTPTSIVGQWTTDLAGTIDTSSGESGVSGLYYDSFKSGFHIYKTESWVDMGNYNFKSGTSIAYFHHDDYLNSPLPVGRYGAYAIPFPYYIASGENPTSGENSVLFYSIGNGWYATDPSADIPAGAVSDGATSGTLAVVMTSTLSDGTVLKTIIRQDGNNTVPQEYAKFNFTLVVDGGTITVSIRANQDYMEFRAYTYSYVNQYGEESGYAEPTTIDVAEGQAVALTYAVPADDGYCPISFVRIYRTASGASGTNYSFVDEVIVNNSQPTYTDEKDGDELGPGSNSAFFEAPPQTLRGLCIMGNGILAGFIGNELYFMEPYLPYAYNPSYIKPLPNTIVGICPTDDGLYVTTTAYPYLITGVTPDAMVDRRVPAIQAGVSKGSICSLGSSVVYASHDGLVMLRGLDASTETSFQFFTREVWRERYEQKLSHMRLNAHDGNILAWFDDGTPGFLIRTEGTVSLTQMTDPVYASFVYPVGDALYVAAGSGVFVFKGANSTKAFTWWSKDFIVPKPVNFGCVQLIGSGEVTFEVYADGELTHTQTIALDDVDYPVYRLPSGFLSRRWSIRLIGKAGTVVNECTLAFSPTELQNG